MITVITTSCGVTRTTSINIGFNGWTELHGIVPDAGAFVMQITGYYGGSGNPPPYTGWYLGPLGPVENIEDATHFGGGSPPVETDALLADDSGGRLYVDGSGDFLAWGGTSPETSFVLASPGDPLVVNGTSEHLLYS